MSSDHIAVNFAALDAGRDALVKMRSDFDSNQEEMANGIAPLRNVWVASGSDAAALYDQSTLKIDQHETQMIELVNDFSRRVDQACQQQIAMENSIAGTFG
ncbi:MAG: WXG100 family type VII secretion target [Phycicoccus sp.]